MPDNRQLQSRLLAIAPLALLVIGIGLAFNYEPTGLQTCEPVEIAGVTVVHGKSSDSTFYNVSGTIESPAQRYIPFDGTFPENYVGPAALWVAGGKWTGRQHFKLTGRCVDLPDQ